MAGGGAAIGYAARDSCPRAGCHDMIADDVFRDRLETTLLELEAWADATRHAADIAVTATSSYWGMAVAPLANGTCPFELVIDRNQTFSLQVDEEIYEKKPIDRFDLFPKLARAVAAGHVDQVTTLSAVTGALLAIESRIGLGDGWAWIGERRIGARLPRRLDTPTLRRVTTFVPYLRG